LGKVKSSRYKKAHSHRRGKRNEGLKPLRGTEKERKRRGENKEVSKLKRAMGGSRKRRGMEMRCAILVERGLRQSRGGGPSHCYERITPLRKRKGSTQNR